MDYDMIASNELAYIMMNGRDTKLESYPFFPHVHHQLDHSCGGYYPLLTSHTLQQWEYPVDSEVKKVYNVQSKGKSSSRRRKAKRTRSVTERDNSSQSRNRKKWSVSEDDRLKKAVQKYKGKNWKNISEEVGGGKTHVQCLQRWQQVLQPGLKKGAWSKDEDKRLLDLMKSLGAVSPIPGERNTKFTDWKKVEKCMNGRTAKQCRERWLLNLDPSINKSAWKREEDESLLDLQSKLGNSWSKIKDILSTNRTENAVKLRYNYLTRLAKKYGDNVLDYVLYSHPDLSIAGENKKLHSLSDNDPGFLEAENYWDTGLLRKKKLRMTNYDSLPSIETGNDLNNSRDANSTVTKIFSLSDNDYSEMLDLLKQQSRVEYENH